MSHVARHRRGLSDLTEGRLISQSRLTCQKVSNLSRESSELGSSDLSEARRLLLRRLSTHLKISCSHRRSSDLPEGRHLPTAARAAGTRRPLQPAVVLVELVVVDGQVVEALASAGLLAHLDVL